VVARLPSQKRNSFLKKRKVFMVILNTILIVVGFFVIGWHIKILKEALNTQSKILSDVKIFMDPFNIDRVKKYVTLSEDTFKLEKEKEIREIKAEIDTKDKSVKQLNAISDSLIDLSFNLFLSMPSTSSMVAINKMPDSPLKERFKKFSANIEKFEKTPRGMGLRAAHQIILSEEKLATGQPPPEDTIKK
jgi:hypothetical protein